MLEEKLRELAQSNRYPFHMPGHKRMLDGTNPYAIDITEIEDFDNLHYYLKDTAYCMGLYDSLVGYVYRTDLGIANFVYDYKGMDLINAIEFA